MEFSNTEIAFSYKSNKELKKSYFIFKVLSYPYLSRIAVRCLPLIKHIPFSKIMIKKTVFSQFCAGESKLEALGTVNKIAKYNVGSILDYSVEGAENESHFDTNCQEIMRVIDLAVQHKKDIPFSVVKPTALGRLDLYEKYQKTPNLLTPKEKISIDKAKERLNTLCKYAYRKQIKFFIDAEESWIQDVIDAWALEMMQLYNKEAVFIYNTVQAYRVGRIDYVESLARKAINEGFLVGLKVVRGAYMEKERTRAKEYNYPSPINKDKVSTDIEYDGCIAKCIKYLQVVHVCAATHNEKSTLKLIHLMRKNNIKKASNQVFFSQLYGMSDHISFNLSNAGYNTAKYLPYGPINDVMPYLVRRSEENTSIFGQMGRELKLLYKELKRRGL